MAVLRNVLAYYWILYYAIYVAIWGYLAWQHWGELQPYGNRTYVLGNISGASAGIASVIAFFVEVIGRMVLLIPKAINSLLARGRKEAHDKAREWWKRKLAAEAKGEPFDEPPPFLSDADGNENER